VKIVLYDDKGVQQDDIETPAELAEEMMAAARKVLHSTRY